MLASDGKCWQRMANVDHARWQSWSAFSCSASGIPLTSIWLAMKRLARPRGQSRSSSLRPICWDWWCMDVHGLTGTASICSLQCWCRCFGTGTVLWNLAVSVFVECGSNAPGWQCNAGHGWPHLATLRLHCEWYTSRRSMTCLARPWASCASGCFWMLDMSGPCKFHHFPKRSHWSSAEPQDLAGPRRTSQVCTVESSLPSWAMVGTSRPQLAETKNWGTLQWCEYQCIIINQHQVHLMRPVPNVDFQENWRNSLA